LNVGSGIELGDCAIAGATYPDFAGVVGHWFRVRGDAKVEIRTGKLATGDMCLKLSTGDSISNAPCESEAGSLGQAWEMDIPTELPRLGDSISGGRKSYVGKLLMWKPGVGLGNCSGALTKGFVVVTAGHCRGLRLNADSPRYDRFFFVPEILATPDIIDAPRGVYEIIGYSSEYNPDVFFGKAVPASPQAADAILRSFRKDAYTDRGLTNPTIQIGPTDVTDSEFPEVVFPGPFDDAYESFGMPFQYRTSKEMLRCKGSNVGTRLGRRVIKCKLFEGASGGPVFRNGTIAAANSISYGDQLAPSFFGTRVRRIYNKVRP
jgi:hypothetical protein